VLFRSLVIGGCGLVGKHIIAQLAANPLQFPSVKSFDLTSSADIKGDITSLPQLLNAFEDIQIVIHTASPRHGLPAEIYWKVNVSGTENVIKACRIKGVKKLIFTSSASVIYNGQHLLNASEDIPYCKVHLDAYNETKAVAEEMVLKANDDKLLTIALRPAGIFGPGDMQASYAIYKAAVDGKHKFMVGENKTLFDMTYVDNVAYAHVLAAQVLCKDNAGEAYNITNDAPIYWFDFAKAIYTGLGKNPSLQYQIPFSVAFPLAHVSQFVAGIFKLDVLFTVYRMTFLSTNRVYSVDKAREKLGYVPIISVEEGIQRTIEWLKTL